MKNIDILCFLLCFSFLTPVYASIENMHTPLQNEVLQKNFSAKNKMSKQKKNSLLTKLIKQEKDRKNNRSLFSDDENIYQDSKIAPKNPLNLVSSRISFGH